MRMFAAALAPVLALCVLATASPSSAETRRYDVGEFHAIEAKGQFRMEVLVGPATSVTLDGPRADIDRLRVVEDGGKLRIEYACTFFCNRRLDVTARVTAPNLREVAAVQGNSASVDGISADDFSLVAVMGGNVVATGHCKSLSADAVMGGVISAESLVCESAEVTAVMGGNAHVYAGRSVEADAVMGGLVGVQGGPDETHTSSVMGGSISLQ